MPSTGRRDVLLRTLPEWRRHAETLDQSFANFGCQYGEPAARWARSNVAEKGDARVVFYPFSGPDFTFAHLIFPGAKTYVLLVVPGAYLM